MGQTSRGEKVATKKRSKWRLAGYIVGGILCIVLATGLVGLLLILHTPPPPVVHIDPAAAKRLQTELEEAQTPSASGTPRVVGADETEVNSLLQEYLRASTAQPSSNNAAVVRDMKLSLTEDRMRLYVLANIRGRDISMTLEGKLRTVNGYLDFEPLSGRIGSLPIPRASLKRALDQMVAAPEGRESMRLPRNLRELHIENGRLVVVFR